MTFSIRLFGRELLSFSFSEPEAASDEVLDLSSGTMNFGFASPIEFEDKRAKTF
ncbi:hypothetical protein SEA_SEPHIROTH_117 [Gordonia Phage Sephiroth]|uniref:Uncharacterized protein n=1 Tax=Gordonia Phage Sephiroth TaxID=2767553 RepID=A0A7G9UZJ6_9CAUD|nr:hypothetical protein L3Y23_gp114 [Gordonia Phage Sephiroth]QNN99451.1 hypothetical protein SEA_SEPHIROTH_117 [Gordonia Phage Sephiroth]